LSTSGYLIISYPFFNFRPEKCRDFKIKDNESYTPLNYSFSEENYNLPVKLDDKVSVAVYD